MLNKTLSEKYILTKNFHGTHFFGKFGVIDFKKLTEERAAALIRAGFPYLKLKKK